MPRVREKSTGRLGTYDATTGAFTPDPVPLPPVTPSPVPPDPPPAPPDLIGRAKAAITDPSEAGRLYPGGPRIGPQVLAPVGTAIRTAGEFILPGSFEQLATQLIMAGVPGGGVARAAERIGGAAAAGGAISAAKGKDPMTGAAEQGGTALVGETLGGVARGALRLGQAAWERTTEGVGRLIGKLVPAFRGQTPAETIRRVISGEGQTALGRQYGRAFDRLITESGDPLVRVPALVDLGRMGPTKGMPDLMRASIAHKHLTALSQAGKPETLGLIRMGRQELEESLVAGVGGQKPVAPAVLEAFQAARQNYARGQAIREWLEGGLKLLQRGRLSEPEVERAFLESRGVLSRAFAPQEFAALERAVTRGSRSPLAFTQPGEWRRLPIPGTRGIPVPWVKAPVRLGRPEDIAEIGARGVRVLGQRGAQEAVGGE